MLAIAIKALGFARGLLSPLASLWRWLAADWHRMAFAVLIALSAFLAWRLEAIDGDRDAWRDRARAYEAASKAIKEADKRADDAGAKVAAETKGKVEDGNERARAAADGSGDPLGNGLRSLRAETTGGRGKAASGTANVR